MNPKYIKCFQNASFSRAIFLGGGCASVLCVHKGNNGRCRIPPAISPSGSITRSKGHAMLSKRTKFFPNKGKVMLAHIRKTVCQSAQVILSSPHSQDLKISQPSPYMLRQVKVHMDITYMCGFNVFIICNYNVFLILHYRSSGIEKYFKVIS